MEIIEIAGLTAAQMTDAGDPLSSEQDALDVMGNLYGTGADLVIFSVARMTPEFFDLRTRIAGEFIQKFTNYRLKIAFVGDLSEAISASNALRDFVHECVKSRDIFFAVTKDELETDLKKSI